MLSKGDKILVLESGRFAIGWGESARRMGVEVEILKGDMRRAVRPEEVEARLKADTSGSIKAVLVAQIDTASGVVNDIDKIGKAIKVAEGTDVTIAATGLMVAEALLAADLLAAEGISARVLDFHTIKAIASAASETGAIVVAEEHLVDSGLGVRIAQVVGEVGPVPMAFVGVENTYAESGTPDELLDKYGLRAKNIAAAVRGVHGKNAARQAGRVLHDQVGSSLAAAWASRVRYSGPPAFGPVPDSPRPPNACTPVTSHAKV